MLITNIEISRYTYCADTSRHSASVCLTLADRIVTLFCSLDLPGETSAVSRAQAFVGDALRQMRRMPEFRTGKQHLQIDKRLAPGSA
ncbi:hypothetical protein [Ruegeria marina]|uniref:Uncharacterized protein n=1 Tax=Ruegeria marina TaxID=639004 RepID=A0A1G6N1J1_9RHOB|nr:hypothetical protein [Ruegeria marina]SDC61702.1 hypothetical protein SAMN04488239_1039 [Ruegeria marina]